MLARRRFRSWSALLVIGSVWTFLGAVCVIGTVRTPHLPDRLLPAAGAVVCAFVVSVATRAGVLVDRDGVEVRRYRGTSQRVPWSEVETFAPVTNGNGGGYIGVVLRDGRVLTTQGLVTARVDSDRAAWLTDELVSCMPDGRPDR